MSCMVCRRLYTPILKGPPCIICKRLGKPKKQQNLFLMAVISKPGGGKGRAIKEKITFFTFFPTAIKLEGGG